MPSKASEASRNQATALISARQHFGRKYRSAIEGGSKNFVVAKFLDNDQIKNNFYYTN
jgi:hypothetical protein